MEHAGLHRILRRADDLSDFGDRLFMKYTRSMIGGAGNLLRCEISTGLMSAPGQIRSSSDVRCTTALPPKAEIQPRSCYVAQVPEAVVSNV